MNEEKSKSGEQKMVLDKSVKEIHFELPQELRAGCHMECQILNGIYYCKVKCDF